MPLISCPACKRDVSSNAETCPHCGEVIAGKRDGVFMRSLNCGCTIFLVILGAIVIFVIAVAGGAGN